MKNRKNRGHTRNGQSNNEDTEFFKVPGLETELDEAHKLCSLLGC